MYESITYQQIMSRLLEKVTETNSDIDTREGSIIYTALAPTAIEIQNIYIDLDNTLNEAFADTASREYLIKRCAERGITPYLATYAVRKGVFNIDISIGDRFSLGELNYVATEKISDYTFKLQCETAGTAGNSDSGTLIPIEYIDGLTTATLSDVIIAGENEETTEALRERYFDSFLAQSFGGNIADYRLKTLGISGVGGVKVYPAWNGGGTVKLVIQSSDLGVPSAGIISTVKETIDPTADSGEGVGLAPIGHVVTVSGIGTTTVNISTKITYESSWNWAAVQSYVETAIDEYFYELAQEWDSQTAIVIRISRIENKLIEITGILDIQDTTLNTVASNLTLNADHIPVRGMVVDNG